MSFNTEEEKVIASFRGIPSRQLPATHNTLGYRYNPRTRSDFGSNSESNKGIPSLSVVIKKIAERYQLEQPRLESILVQNWRAIVGDENAHYCFPKKVESDHKLIIAVSHAVIRSELLFQRRNILNRLNQLAGLETIKEVMFVSG